MLGLFFPTRLMGIAGMTALASLAGGTRLVLILVAGLAFGDLARGIQDHRAMPLLVLPIGIGVGIAGMALGAGDLGMAPLEVVSMTEFATSLVILERLQDEFSVTFPLFPVGNRVRIIFMTTLAALVGDPSRVVSPMAGLAFRHFFTRGIAQQVLAMPLKGPPADRFNAR